LLITFSFSIIKKIKGNIENIKFGQLVISFIKNTFEDVRRTIPEFIKKFYEGEELKKIQKVVKEAKAKVKIK